MNSHYFKYLLFACGLILISSSSCHKDIEPDLVPITMTGENTMGFYLDGEPINVKGKSGYSNHVGIRFSHSPFLNFYQINCGASVYISNLVIYIHERNLQTHSSIILKEPFGLMGWAEILDRSPNGGTFFKTDSVHGGKLVIIKFTDDVIAGTFEFTIYENSLPKYIVTDGRFDIKRYK